MIIIFNLFLSSILMLLCFFCSKMNILNLNKLSSFECGFETFFSSRIPFSLHFFKIALIFLIFDIEILIILPIPLIYSLKMTLFIFLMIFLILGSLFIEWILGSLNWKI